VCLLGMMLIAGCGRNAGEVNPGFDFSGTEQFLKIMKMLEQDREPSEIDWKDLFETSGYAVLLEKEGPHFSEDFFMKHFRLAFKPSKKDELENELQNPKNYRRNYLQHYLRVKNMREDILAQIDFLKKTPLTQDAILAAFEYLPAAKIRDYPPVSFIIFGNDARGYSPIVIDIAYAQQQGEIFFYLLAHEYHHFYRNRILEYDEEIIAEEDKDIIWTLNQVQGEGMADQIDKRKAFYSENILLHNQDATDRYREAVERTPEIIKAVDELFCRIADSPGKKRELGQQIRKTVPWSGHTTGFYMTNVILDQLGKIPLLEEAGNPFGFFRLYNQAATKRVATIPVFSDKALSVVAGLEKKYIIEEQQNGH